MRARLYFHLVWTTYERVPVIDRTVAVFLCDHLREQARRHSLRILAIGCVRTHIHLLVTTGTELRFPFIVGQLKGGSSYAVNRECLAGAEHQFRWAPGYTIETVSPRSVPMVRAYLRAQPQHHPGEAIEGWSGDRQLTEDLRDE
jgi:putative transposase